MNPPSTPSARSRFGSLGRLACLGLALPLGLLALSLLGFFPWSRINCWTDEVDIRSGRFRDTQYLFWCPIASSVRDSALTRALLPADRADGAPDWRRVNTFSPGLHYSPHHGFHGAMAQIRLLQLCWEMGQMPPAAQRATARQVLRRWRETDRYYSAQEYLEALGDRAQAASKQGKILDLSDLPPP